MSVCSPIIASISAYFPITAKAMPVLSKFKFLHCAPGLVVPFDISALRRLFQGLTLFMGVFFLASPVHADPETYDTPSNGPVPRWAMLSKGEVYARNGPSKDNRIVWTYHAVNLPVQIISETHDWRLICDPDGDVAWVSRGLLRNSRTVLSLNRQKLPLYDDPNPTSSVRAILRGQALAQLDKCKKDWCRISAGGVSGWVPQNALWGTQTKAICQRPDPLATR